MRNNDRIKLWAGLLVGLLALNLAPCEGNGSPLGWAIYGGIVALIVHRLFVAVNENQRAHYAQIRPNSRRHRLDIYDVELD